MAFASNRREFLRSAALVGTALELGVKPEAVLAEPVQEAASSGQEAVAAAGTLTREFAEPLVPFPMDMWCLPRVQFWSFDNRDPLLEAMGYQLSVQVTTTGADENTYSLHAGSVKQSRDEQGVTITAGALASAGQQREVPGRCEIRVSRRGADRCRVGISAVVDGQTVRAVKLILRQLPAGRVGFTSFEAVPNLAPVPPEALALAYPTYQGGAPVWFLATEGERGISFSSVDVSARQRRFVAAREGDGRSRIELVFEEDARKWSSTLHAPEWEIRSNTTLDEALADRCALLEREAGLRAWERRADVPAWVHEIGLVVCLHGMHWSGYVLQDYAQMRASVEWVLSRIPGRSVLFFVAGWEGRYYRSYGNSVPDERMGGQAGFRSVIEAAHAQGAHVMAMYAGNAAMPGTPGFDGYAAGSRFEADNSLGWTPMRGYTVDWSTVRGSDTNGSAWLNPGAPGWQKHLTEQVRATVRDYGIDGAFFDTQPNFDNDRRYQPTEGLRRIVGDLREQTPNLMIATESWADITYGFLHAGQTPSGYRNWSARYGRRFAHLAMGEPSRGSTGVHELGYCQYNFEQLMTLFDWPTLALVDTTLRDAPEKAERVIAYARERLKRA